MSILFNSKAIVSPIIYGCSYAAIDLFSNILLGKSPTDDN